MGGTPTYAYRDGQRLAPAVAVAFDRMAAAYYRDIGYTLHVAVGGGLRTRAEQQKLRDDYLAGRGNLAADPDDPRAYHVESNPNGARAIDIYDSGPAGVGPSSGTGPGHQWMLDHAHEYGFENEGLSFSPREPWHKKWTGTDPWATPAPALIIDTKEHDVKLFTMPSKRGTRLGGCYIAVGDQAVRLGASNAARESGGKIILGESAAKALSNSGLLKFVGRI